LSSGGIVISRLTPMKAVLILYQFTFFTLPSRTC